MSMMQVPSPDANAGRRTRLLVVEDHEHMARMMRCLLEQEGFDVQTAGTLTGALELARSQPFDLVLSDLTLPDGDGADLPAQLERIGPLPAIALSGHATEEDAARSLAAGFIEHLIKPIGAEELAAAIRRALQSVPIDDEGNEEDA